MLLGFGDHLLVHAAGKMRLARVNEHEPIFQLADDRGIQMNREDSRVGVFHLHEVDTAISAGELILNPAFELEVLNLEQLRLARDLMRQKVPTAIPHEGADRRDSKGC